MKKLLFGLAWFIVFYFGTCTVIGAIAGGIAGANDPENAAKAGAQAAAQVVGQYRLYILLGSVILAGLGTAKGWLPGTRVARLEPPEDEDLY